MKLKIIHGPALAFLYSISSNAEEINTSTFKKESENAKEETLTVTAKMDDPGITEGTDSYTTLSANTSTKLNLSFRETPQSTTVITRKRMNDLSTKNIVDVVQNTPGLYVSTSGGSGRPSFMSRGFYANVMYEGFSSSFNSYIPSSQTNTAILDRVEVTRGSTGLSQGDGNPSAAINMIYKRPLPTNQSSATLGYGRWNRSHATLDSSRLLNDSGSLRGRFVVDGEMGGHSKTLKRKRIVWFMAFFSMI